MTSNKHILIIILALAMHFCPSFAQNRHALLIGIGEYPLSSGWRRINGDSDIPVMKKYLLDLGFKSSDICTLVNDQATKKAIVSSLEDIAQKATYGDIIFVHFSGHGQQITDLDGDEADGFDEAWIPYDAGREYIKGVYEGQNHLVDDELNTLFFKIRNRIGDSGRMIIISDSCHSGGASRGKHDDIIRGVRDRFMILGDSQPYSEEKVRHISWLYVAACKSNESNHEYHSNDGYIGMLTYVIATDTKVGSTSTWQEAIDIWRQRIEELRIYPQHLDYEGAPSKKSSRLF